MRPLPNSLWRRHFLAIALGRRILPFTPALLMAGCSFDGMIRQASQMAANKGYISHSQAKGLSKAGTALRKSAEEISESEEYYIGRAVSAQILARYKTLPDERLNGYAQAVVQTIAAASERPAIYKGYHVQILDSNELNALSAPGGFIFVTKGLMARLKSEDELACVLGHEVAHIAKKHGLKTIQAAHLTKAFSALGTAAAETYTSQQISQLTQAFEGAIDDVVKKLVVTGYSRDKEYEADYHGGLYAQAANYDPQALNRFISGLGIRGLSGGVLKTHPGPEQRLDKLSDRKLEPASGYMKSAARSQRFSAAFANL